MGRVEASQKSKIQYFFATAALVFAALALHLTCRRIVVLRSGGVATGQITDHDRREIDESVGYHPTVSFIDHTGKERRFTSSSGWHRPKPSVGTAVAVVYLRSNPERAYISSVFHLWAGPVAMLVLALAAVAGAVKVSA